MSLPFLKPKTSPGMIIQRRTPDGSSQIESMDEGDENAPLSACSADLIRAVHAKDESAVSSALRAAFEILSSEDQPSESGEQE